VSRDPAVRHSYRVLAVAPEQTRRWEKVRRRVTDLAAPPTAVAREVGDPDLAVWQAALLDLREREPVTAMAVLRAGVTGARRRPTWAKAAGGTAGCGRGCHHDTRPLAFPSTLGGSERGSPVRVEGARRR
jgi:hypothetical protein